MELAVPATGRMTVEEYLRTEVTSPVRREYRNGRAIEMSGGSFNHTVVTVNVVAELRAALRDKGCQAIDGNLRIRVPRTSSYYYADAGVVCGPPTFQNDGPTSVSLLNPNVIFEVLSPSTEAFDRGEKFTDYRTIESLRQYVLIAQHVPRIEFYTRLEEGAWRFNAVDGLDSKLRLESIDIEVSLSEIFAGVTFEPESEMGVAVPVG